MNPQPNSPLSELDRFASLAPFYDLDLEGHEDDVDLYRHLAGEGGGGGVLELGCGTGRVACALAGEGLDVTGVDLSAAMLEVAGRRVAAAGGSLVNLVEADLRRLDLGRRFSLVLAPLGTLQHMETTDDLVAALRTIARHLAADGLAVVDVEHPLPEDLTPGPQPLIEHWTRRIESGASVTKLVSVEAHPALGTRTVTWHFDVQPPEGALHRVTSSFELRTITLTELDLAARLAGLAVSAAWGDYAMTPYDDSATRLVAALSPAGEPTGGASR